MKRPGFLLMILVLIALLVVINTAACQKKETREIALPDGRKVVTDHAGNVIRSSLPVTFASLIDKEIAKRLGITSQEVEHRTPEEIEKLNRKFKDTLSAFSQVTIASAHELLNRYIWPDNKNQHMSLRKLKQEIGELEKDWKTALESLEEFRDIPAVEAYINDVNRAFGEVKKGTLFNWKSIENAHNIFHDLDSIWWETGPTQYGVTGTEKALADYQEK